MYIVTSAISSGEGSGDFSCVRIIEILFTATDTKVTIEDNDAAEEQRNRDKCNEKACQGDQVLGRKVLDVM
jgi:hypothetical protein